MKLNAKISSERASRTVSKSGDEFIKIELTIGNEIAHKLLFESKYGELTILKSTRVLNIIPTAKT